MFSWIKNNRVEWLAGVTTGLTAVPTAVAFAILAGVQPSVGLRGTWMIMLVMSLFGGKRSTCYALRIEKEAWSQTSVYHLSFRCGSSPFVFCS